MSEDIGDLPVSKGDLTRKIGPLPLWAWVTIPAVAYIGYRYWEASRNPPVASSGDSGATGYSDVASPTDLSGLSGGGPSYSSSPSPGTVTTGPEGATSNASWADMVLSALTAGGTNPTAANNALTSYLNGIPLTNSQAGIINGVIGTYGAPPEGLIPVTLVPPPAPPKVTTPTPTASKPKVTTPTPTASKPKALAAPHVTVANNNTDTPTVQWSAVAGAKSYSLYRSTSPTPVNTTGTSHKVTGSSGTFYVIAHGDGKIYAANSAHSNSVKVDAKAPAKASTKAKASTPTAKTYTVKSGDTLFDIAQRFYGNGNEYTKIASANHIANPSLIHAGLKLTIPK